MTPRSSIVLILGLLLACESPTGLRPGDLVPETSGNRTLLSADFVMTVLTPEGLLYSWGSGYAGTLGQGDFKSHADPTRVPGLSDVIDYDQDFGMAFALREDGSVFQWGHYVFSSMNPNPNPNPTRATGVANAVALFAQRWELYIVDMAGSLWLTSPSHVDPRHTPAPQRIPLSKPVSLISGALGLYRDGTLFSLQESPPEEGGPVAGLQGIVAIDNDFESTLALLADGTVWAWGQAPSSGLGDGIHTESSVPIQLPGLSGVRKISGRSQRRFAVKEDGTVWFWGFRGRDENDQKIYQEVPIQVPGITDAVDVAAHWEALILTAGGDLYVFETETLDVKKVPFS